MFEIMCQFGYRGEEGLHELTKRSILIKFEAKERNYVKIAYNEADKTHSPWTRQSENRQGV